MREPADYKQFGILYLDDEEQALKYFKKAFDAHFRIVTANTFDQALAVLEKNESKIGIVISDQRMPGRTGVQLLTHIRQAHPNIIRILTTAYADLDSAIDAVNSGAIYKYIVKPWDTRDLSSTLMRAMDFYLLQRERDSLLREKLSVLQRLIIADRVRSLAVLAAGLAHHIRNSMMALTTFLQFVPLNLKKELPYNSMKSTELWDNMWSLAQRESDRILEIVKQVSDATGTPVYQFGDSVTIGDIVKAASRENGAAAIDPSVRIPENFPPVMVDRVMLQRCFKSLLLQLKKLSPTAPVVVECRRVDSVWGTPGLEMRMFSEGAAWTPDQIATLFTPFVPTVENPKELGLELLSSFFIIHHHGGDISVEPHAPRGPGFILHLPFDPESAHSPKVEQSCMEKLFVRFDIEDAGA